MSRRHHSTSNRPVGSQPSERWLRAAALLELLAIVFILTTYAALKCYALHAHYDDENVYFYMSRQVTTRALLPYRDFFFAHPPLHLVPLVLLSWLNSECLLPMRLEPIIATLISGVLLYGMARRAWGRLAGVITLAAFLLGTTVLNSSSNPTGVNLATTFLVASLSFAMGAYAPGAGICAALAALTGGYAIFIAVGLAIVVAVTQRPDRTWRPFWYYMLSFLVTWIGINLLMLVIFGLEYLNSVYLFQLRLPAEAFGNRAAIIASKVLWENFALVWSFPLASMLFGFSLWPRRSTLGAGIPGGARAQSNALWLAATLLTLSYVPLLLREHNLVESHFTPIFPWLSLLAGYSISELAALVCRAEMRPWWARLTTAVIAVVIIALGRPVGNWIASPTRRQAQIELGGPVQATWVASPILPRWANATIRAVWWSDTFDPQRNYLGPTYHLWNEATNYDQAVRQIAGHVAKITGPKQTIYGDMEIVPLIALLAHRRVAAEMADSSGQRVLAKTITVDEIWQRITADHVAVIILRPGADMDRFPRFHQLMEKDFVPDQRVVLPGDRKLQLYRRRSSVPMLAYRMPAV